MSVERRYVDEDQWLQGAGSWQYRPARTDRRLGEDIDCFFQQHSRILEKNAALLDLWPQVVPPLLAEYCRPGKRVGNTLYVEVTPGPYMHQMQMFAGQLLENIKQLSPRCGIQKIRVTPKTI